MEYEIKGKLIAIMPTVRRGQTFYTRRFVLEVREHVGYHDRIDRIQFELLGGDTSRLDALQSGDDLTVIFRIEGHEWQGKYFVTLRAVDLQLES